jgi:hypothetical protein
LVGFAALGGVAQKRGSTKVCTAMLAYRQPSTPDVYTRYWTTGESATHPGTWPSSNVPYLDDSRFGSSSTIFANFYNQADYALNGGSLSNPGWIFTQKTKPNSHFVPNGLPFFYTSGRFYEGANGLEFPSDTYKIFSFAAGSWSIAMGTAPTGGVFTELHSLSSELNYGNEHLWHSGQFRGGMAARNAFGSAILDACEIVRTNDSVP